MFEKYKIPSVMSNVATPKVYESGFKYIAGMALDASTWSKNYFDMLEHMNPKPKSVFWIVQDNLVTKAVHETQHAICRKGRPQDGGHRRLRRHHEKLLGHRS